MDNKLNEYKQRQRDWRNISIAQLSNANNILLTLSTGLLVFAIGNRKEKIQFGFSTSINWADTLFMVSIIFMCASILYGTAVLFCRLYDFRISRHMALTRQRFYTERKGNGLLSDNFQEDPNCAKRITVFWETLFCKIGFIQEAKSNNYNYINEKFSALGKRTAVLGNASWIWIKYQVLFFLLSALLYLTTQLFYF